MRPLVKTALHTGATCPAATCADGRRALSADRRHAFANQTAPPTPSDATTPALLPSRNQPTRRLSASCWQDVTRMKRWCRLSALQAKQALGHVHTWHCGTSASASATAVPLPASLPKASSVYCALDLTCAALEPRPTHHLLVAPAPAQAFAGTALSSRPSDPQPLARTLPFFLRQVRAEQTVRR